MTKKSSKTSVPWTMCMYAPIIPNLEKSLGVRLSPDQRKAITEELASSFKMGASLGAMMAMVGAQSAQHFLTMGARIGTASLVGGAVQAQGVASSEERGDVDR
jgi:hypothetical protein